MLVIKPPNIDWLSPEVKKTMLYYGTTLDGGMLSWSDFEWNFTDLRENFTHTRLEWFKADMAGTAPHKGWRPGKNGSIYMPRLALEGAKLQDLEAYSGLGHHVRVTMALAEDGLDIALRPSNLFDSRQQIFYVRPGDETSAPVSVSHTPVLINREQAELKGVIPRREAPPHIVSALYLLGNPLV